MIFIPRGRVDAASWEAHLVLEALHLGDCLACQLLQPCRDPAQSTQQQRSKALGSSEYGHDRVARVEYSEGRAVYQRVCDRAGLGALPPKDLLA